MNMHDLQPLLTQLARGISALFGDNCEVTVHDLAAGYENSIVAIENGHITGRQIGDGASEKVLQAMKKNEPMQDKCGYLAQTKDGRLIKSSTIYVKDAAGEAIGLFGINYDITDLTMAQRALDIAVSVKEPEGGEGIATITSNVTDLLDQLIEEADKHVGLPVAKMGKEEKTRAIHFLSERGAFLIKKAGDKVSKHYDISKFTLYNYMDAES